MWVELCCCFTCWIMRPCLWWGRFQNVSHCTIASSPMNRWVIFYFRNLQDQHLVKFDCLSELIVTIPWIIFFCYCILAVHWLWLLLKRFNKHSSNCMIYTLWWSQIHLVKMQRETRAKTEDEARREFLKAIRVYRRRQRIEFITYHLPSKAMHFNLHLNLPTNG